MERMSDSESDDDDEDFAVENTSRLPPPELLYNGQGMSAYEGQEARNEDLVRDEVPALLGNQQTGSLNAKQKQQQVQCNTVTNRGPKAIQCDTESEQNRTRSSNAK